MGARAAHGKDRTEGVGMSEQNYESMPIRRRLGGEPSQDLVQYLFIPRLEAALRYSARHEWEIHLAHVLMLKSTGIVPAESAGRLLAALLDLEEISEATLDIDHTQEDLYSYVERKLIAQLGPAIGGLLQTGRSRNDLHTTAWRMALRAELVEMREALVTLQSTVHDVAAKNVDTVMPGYTHTQHAQPVTLGYYLSAFQEVLRRDSDRLMSLTERVNVCPLGAAALSASSYPLDRELTSGYLGFSGPSSNGYDSIASRDDAYEAAAVLAVWCTSISRFATDLKMWNTYEFGFIELSDEYAVASSIMPQKKSPISLERVTGLCAQTIGDCVSVLSCARNTSFADVNDGVTEPNAILMRSLANTKMAISLLTGVISNMRINGDTMREKAERGFGTATDVADLIVREAGVSFRVAHNIVGVAVRQATSEGKNATQLSSKDLRSAAQTVAQTELPISEADLIDALDPARSIHTHTVAGGPAREVMEPALTRQGEQITASRQGLQKFRDAVRNARESLLRDARDNAKV